MGQEFVGDKIKRLREARRISQVGLRRFTGLSQTTVYRAEVGGVVTPETARRLAPVLGVSAEELLDGAKTAAASAESGGEAVRGS